MSLNGLEFIRRFEEYCPLELAEEGDPVGLHIGQLDREMERVMFTLDVRPETVAEAIENKIDLIVAKHPPIFRPISRLDYDDAQTKMYADCIKHDIAVYAAHTNLDIIENGLNDWFCEELGIEEATYLKATHNVAYHEVALHIDPKNKVSLLTYLAELTTETISEETPEYNKTVITFPVVETEITKMRNSLEDISEEIPMEQQWKPLHNKVKTFGIGRIGDLSEPIMMEKFISQIKETFNLDGLRLVCSNPDQAIQRVAICGGSGEKFYRDALAKDADVYLTGDVYYHTGHDMLTAELPVIDPGHHIEVLCQPRLLSLANEWKEVYNWDIEFSQSLTNTNPFKYY
ncbi:Nif3-like dinuclear metal center hexameric protein [Vagococcus coleopterorum]|uniref:GTP cyclohydrolase 1 type 2 homolog n=1 Tax=Vagococcus coleopterorum TaxID=2714946 RepID=A0A6G8APN6_9ENTE|nr:Nif3-like dinuclear metal center hexameric protein [Vagococcus coleopterorum]QIL46883.1 Nif3-like dinuclear metal center hexameric protein [Vagococcus coleopterorum]